MTTLGKRDLWEFYLLHLAVSIVLHRLKPAQQSPTPPHVSCVCGCVYILTLPPRRKHARLPPPNNNCTHLHHKHQSSEKSTSTHPTPSIGIFESASVSPKQGHTISVCLSVYLLASSFHQRLNRTPPQHTSTSHLHIIVTTHLNYNPAHLHQPLPMPHQVITAQKIRA